MKLLALHLLAASAAYTLPMGDIWLIEKQKLCIENTAHDCYKKFTSAKKLDLTKGTKVRVLAQETTIINSANKQKLVFYKVQFSEHIGYLLEPDGFLEPFAPVEVSSDPIEHVWVGIREGVKFYPISTPNKAIVLPYLSAVHLLKKDGKPPEGLKQSGKMMLCRYQKSIGWILEDSVQIRMPEITPKDIPYKHKFSYKAAESCCKKIKGKSDPYGDECAGAGRAQMLDYGWTPTLAELKNHWAEIAYFYPYGVPGMKIRVPRQCAK